MSNQINVAQHVGTLELLEPRVLFDGNSFVQTNLVSDGAVPAATIDADLKNPWGLAFSPTSPFWIADNGTSQATIYNASGVKQTLVVSIPGAGGEDSEPTGEVFNGTSSFVISKGAASGPARFIFVGEDGGISGWNPSVDATHAILIKDNSAQEAIYKGVTIATSRGRPQLYVADFHNARVEVYDGRFNPVHLRGAFEDRFLPDGFAPFNVQAVDGIVYVTYAKQDEDAEDDVAGPGNGYVDEYNPAGVLIRRLRHGDYFNSPWGVAKAPEGFGPFGGDVLIGQFGSGRIAAFNPDNGKFQGFLQDSAGAPIENDGLWALRFGNGTGSSTLFFTAGLNDEADGLFGKIELSV
jgi:uncharacterized protein (TIGR03118 family)